jgi:hypothetical protein
MTQRDNDPNADFHARYLLIDKAGIPVDDEFSADGNIISAMGLARAATKPMMRQST